MMNQHQKVYDLNLRGVDVTEFESNPIVVSGWEWSINSLVGRARVLRQKRKVLVDFMESPPEYPHDLGAATVTDQYGTVRLIGLSIVARLPESKV